MTVCLTTYKHGRFLPVISRDSFGTRYSKISIVTDGNEYPLSMDIMIKIFDEIFSIFSVWVGLKYIHYICHSMMNTVGK